MRFNFGALRARNSAGLLASRSILRRTGLSKLGGVCIQALDLGARGGLDRLLTPIAPLVDYVGFDPDPHEIVQLRRAGAMDWRSVRYVAAALGRPDAVQTLHVTQNPECTSLFESNPEVVERYGMHDLFRIIDTALIPTRGLDELAVEQELSEASYLKMDIQGAELEVLRTAPRLLEQSLTTLRVEVEFQPIYRQQPLFSDVNAFVVAQGFVLAGFHEPRAWALQAGGGARFQVSRDCLGDMIHADALYLRHPDRYSTHDERGIVVCVRGALLALALGRVSHCAALLARPAVAEWLLDVHKINANDVIRRARGEMVRHQRHLRWIGVMDALRAR